MYSYEDRARAVKLYIKLGKRAAATIHRLGYPTKNSLRSWHREFERCHDLPAGYVRSKPKYSDEQKNVAVDHYSMAGFLLLVVALDIVLPSGLFAALALDAVQLEDG